MIDSKTIEAVLAPHRESLMCLIDFAVDGNNLSLAARAATKQFQSFTGERRHGAKHTLDALVLFAEISFEPVKDGKIDYSVFTKEVCDALWEICTLTSCQVVKAEFPELARNLRAAEFGFHAELAKAQSFPKLQVGSSQFASFPLFIE